MTSKKLDAILEKHLHWLRQDIPNWENMRANLLRADLYGANLYEANLSGAYLLRANLSGADLLRANLYEANLYGANLYEANLLRANLSGANLSGANLSGANLLRANLSGADLYEANLSGANLSGANLSGANLLRANLSGADLYEANLSNDQLNRYFPICCPEVGSFIGWKKCSNNYIVKLQILEDAKRSSALGRKCRCSSAKVLAIENIDGSESGITEISSNRDSQFIYKIGEIVSVPDFDENRKRECSTGIHFFITRQEAVDYFS